MSYKVKFLPVNVEIEIEEGEKVLDAAFRQGVLLAHGCREGQCSACKSVMVDGDYDLDRYSTFALPDYESEQGYVLLCQTLAYSDLTIELLNYNEEHMFLDNPIRTVSTEVSEIKRLTHDITRLRLRLKPGESLSFKAGQYVDIRLPGVDPARSFSMSSLPSQPEELEFMIKIIPGGYFSGILDQRLQVGDELEVTGPFGNFYYREGAEEMYVIGGGAGMAPLWSLMCDMAEKGIDRKIRFFYGARTARDLFYLDEIRELQDRFSDFAFVPALSEPSEGDNWSGATGMITEVLENYLQAHPPAAGIQGYLCGPPPMIDAAIRVLTNHGAEERNIFYDKFTASTK
ncbi:Oxidoreductase FAD-binding domain protein [Kyrpidia tusciae DSM 2912]|uniref:Oxidoreductase FAD-binding domain protein n=1 Tax=Kyrpidia tusciae (strain DSM 2912 / NBRC 15312 / T2) TaxID=562970 RepID=D5WPK3_KYRT2|nr:Oxidoreductase FAD-binding domain protein [Kyrpidia tusciae DSM 2912]